MKSLLRALQFRVHEAELALLRRTHPLRFLVLEVTRRCNLACAYCGSACNGAPQGEELSASEWIRVIREIVQDFDATKMTVEITGGEPLVKEGIFDILNELGRLGCRFGMVSNGQLLDQSTARTIVRSGLRSLSLSLDAPFALNDELRGRGASQKVVSAIDAVRAAGYRGTLEIISTITTPAIACLDEMRRIVSELKIPRWRVVPVMPLGRAAERPDLVPDNAGLRTILEYVREARADGFVPVPELCDEGFLGDEFEMQVRPYLWQCTAGVTLGSVLCDGRIGACTHLSEAFVQGDVRRERFRTVWEERFQILRDRSWANHGVCASCAEFARCQGGSLHLYAKPGAKPARCLLLDAVRRPA